MEAYEYCVFIILLCLISVAYWYFSVPKHLPPGTAGIPILGYLPFADKQLHLAFTELGKSYGNLYYVYLGSRLAIVLNDFTTIKEALVKQSDIFSGRCLMAEFENENEKYSGVIFTDGEHWKQHRRFILHNLRDYGVGKLTLEPLLLDEIQHFLTELRNRVHEPIEIKEFLLSSLTNNIHILVTGKRHDYDSPFIKNITKPFKMIEQLGSSIGLANFFPWAKPILNVILRRKTQLFREIDKLITKSVEDSIREAKNEYIDGQNHNYLNAYLTERNNRLRINKNEDIFTELGLLHITKDLLGAGTDTSATALAWSVVYMALYPEVLTSIQQEIDRVIGNREPSYNDRGSTPYTEATICELHRVISLTPLTVVHRNIREGNLLGYKIPKDTMIFPNIWAVHNDKKLWGDPENFRPERFLNDKGECVRPEYLIPFSIGKRACAGEPLARMEIYLYFVSLIQNFEFEAPPGEKLSTEGVLGFLRHPKSKIICLKLRK